MPLGRLCQAARKQLNFHHRLSLQSLDLGIRRLAPFSCADRDFFGSHDMALLVRLVVAWFLASDLK